MVVLGFFLFAMFSVFVCGCVLNIFQRLVVRMASYVAVTVEQLGTCVFILAHSTLCAYGYCDHFLAHLIFGIFHYVVAVPN